MANPPYSGFILIARENQDGITAKVYIFSDVPEGSPIPRNVAGLETSLFNAIDTSKTPPDSFIERSVATRSAFKTAVGQLVDSKFPDTAA